MAGLEDRYTRAVGWLKIVLPLIALAILSTLFLLPKERDPEAAIPYADVDVRELAREQRIGAPAYTAVLDDGARLTVLAEAVRLDPSAAGATRAQGVEARIEGASGTTAISARTGLLAAERDVLILQDEVRVAVASGFSLSGEHVTINLEAASVTSRSPVALEAPFGRLTAGAMHLARDGQLAFSQGVRLVYEPDTGGPE